MDCFSSLPGVPRPQCGEEKPRQGLPVSPLCTSWSSGRKEPPGEDTGECRGHPGVFCWATSVSLTWSGRLGHSGPMNFFLSPQCQVLRQSRDSEKVPSPGQIAMCVGLCVKDGVYVTEHSQR